jgi:micrococcal nuclease
MARPRAVVVATVLAAASLGGWWSGQARRAATSTYPVERVIDGDTIIVRRGGRDETIRILGVDTPETHDPRKPVQCYGPEAAAYTARRLTGARVRLEEDVVTHDKYGRTLAYVYVDGRRFEDELLTKGYARLLVIDPNRAHAFAMLREELDAKRAGKGLWNAC